jgi:outer membrane protein assembly factor BamB
MQAKQTVIAACAAVVTWSVLMSVAPAADWPKWRGPDGNGISSETNWSPAAVQTTAKVLWKASVGAGYSAPTVRGQSVYVMGNKNNRDIVWCLSAATGQPVWTKEYDCKAESYPGPRASPTIDGDCVYTFSRDGQAFCLDAATGAVKWSRNLQAECKAEAPRWGFAASVAIEGDLAIYNAGAHGAALNKLTGATVWSSPGTGGYSTPVFFADGGRRCAAVFGEKGIYAVDVKTGEALWSYPWVTSYDINAADPLIVGRNVLITSGYGNGCALLDVSSGKAQLVWQNKAISSQFSSLVLLDGYVYGVDGNVGKGGLTCLDLKTGASKWRKDLGFGSLIAANGKLIVLNEAGDLFIVDAAPGGYNQLACAQRVLGRTCWTAPVLSNGHLYCRNEKGDFVCIDLGQ